jgi:DNA replication protein DnaC
MSGRAMQLIVAVRSLAGGQGGGFFFNGVFGSGKSHLLGCSLCCAMGLGHETFAGDTQSSGLGAAKTSHRV